MTTYPRAFVAPDILSLGDRLVDAVVMADRMYGRLSISIYPITPPPELAGLTVQIYDQDLVEVKRLLNEDEQTLLRPEDHLTIALTALRQIADMDVDTPADWSFSQIAMTCIDIAQDALGRMDDDGAATDS